MSKKIAAVRSAAANSLLHFYRLRALGLCLPAAGGLMLAAIPAAHAMPLYDGSQYGNNWEVYLNTTVNYSGFYRVGHPSAILESGKTNANGNDGDANFHKDGIVGNIFSILPVLDIKNQNFGMHFSGEYFINTVYLQGNQNNQHATINSIVSSPTSFATETRQANGSNGRMLDAFVYDSWNFGDQEFSLKAGQQTLFWGQSLFFGTNGISGGQAPIDSIVAQSLVNPQTQQIYLPDGQIVVTYQPNQTYTLQGYYQYQWQPTTVTGVGSYFSQSDVTGPGSSRIVAVAGTTDTNGRYFYQGKALTPPSQNGQFGASIQAQYGPYDIGLFGLRYDSKTATVYEYASAKPVVRPAGEQIGTYKEVYPRDIQLYGASVSTDIGATNLAGELSARRNMNLAGSAPVIKPGGNPGNANSDPLYPVGNTMTGLVSAVYGSPTLAWAPGGVSVASEVEYVRVLGVTANKAALAPGRTSSAAAFDVQVTPAYYNVLPKLELTFPVSVKYNFAGNSQMDPTMNHGTGQVTFGIVATYHTNWIASLNYIGYFGKPATSQLTPEGAPNADRSYMTLNLQHTF